MPRRGTCLHAVVRWSADGCCHNETRDCTPTLPVTEAACDTLSLREESRRTGQLPRKPRLQDPAKCGAQPSQTGFERERGNHTDPYRCGHRGTNGHRLLPVYRWDRYINVYNVYLVPSRLRILCIRGLYRDRLWSPARRPILYAPDHFACLGSLFSFCVGNRSLHVRVPYAMHGAVDSY